MVSTKGGKYAMVAEETTKIKGNARKGTRNTSQKKKQQEDSPESSDDDTKGDISVTERTERTLQEAELKATETFLKAQTYLDGNQVKAITQTYGVTTRRELGLLTRAQITDEILTGASKKLPRLQGSKISLLLSEIETYLRGEFQWEADGDVHWNTATPLIPPIHTRVVSERPQSVTSALTHILPEHAHLVKGGVPSVEIVSDEEDKLHDHAHDAAENLPVPPLSDDDEEENLPVPRLADEDDIIFLKSHNTSDPIVRCRDQGAAEGLDTGGWEVGEELEVQHWIGGSSPPSTAVTAVGKGQQGKVTSRVCDTRGRYDRPDSEASDGLLSRHTESNPAAGESTKGPRSAKGAEGRGRGTPSTEIHVAEGSWGTQYGGAGTGMAGRGETSSTTKGAGG